MFLATHLGHLGIDLAVVLDGLQVAVQQPRGHRHHPLGLFEGLDHLIRRVLAVRPWLASPWHAPSIAPALTHGNYGMRAHACESVYTCVVRETESPPPVPPDPEQEAYEAALVHEYENFGRYSWPRDWGPRGAVS